MRTQAKALASRIPWAPELYQDWFARQRPPENGFAVERLVRALPSWSASVERARAAQGRWGSRRILVVGFLPWWLEYSVALGLLLSAQGARVDLGFLPYRRWMVPGSRFDARRQTSYLRSVLALAPRLTPIDLSAPCRLPIPPSLSSDLDRLAVTDVEYSIQRENPDFERDGEAAALLALRRGRNRLAAANTLRLLRQTTYDTVVIPNGSILEFGAAYAAARSRQVPTVTYEFGEQRERVWICRDGEAMRLDTLALWEARGQTTLTAPERQQIEDLVRARKGGLSWGPFGRRWQKGQRQGADSLRQFLGLDARPVVLVATNVVGDSLALNRQIFTAGMADWLSQTLQVLAGRADVQTVVRIHPGELLGAGMPSERVVRNALPDLPAHVTVIAPDSEINTYDLIENAHVGLVYTSTAGLEMAMHGVPVVTAGQTHYRGKGFTDDPDTLSAYLSSLDQRLAQPVGRRLEAEQVDLAWRYAHRFFFEYPFAFPWHLLHFWTDVAERPLEAVARPGGAELYQEALDIMVGEPIDWEAHALRN
jgi:hypothetical protein